MKYESLHTHTVISDGQQTHLEVLESAEQYGFGLIVFTDHDILPRPRDMSALKAYTGPVKWKIGIEISAGWPEELGGGPANLLHILALNIDLSDKSLQEYCQAATEARLDRMKRTLENLKREGFVIKLERCLELAGEGAAATPHLVRALLEDEANITRLELLFADMQRHAEDSVEMKTRYEALEYRYKELGQEL